MPNLTEAEKRAARAARFAREASAPVPAVPKKRMAWPGGKISSNKEEATAKFLERQGGSTRLFVRNVVSDKELKELFPGASTRFVKGKNIGFVTFANAAQASAALKLNGSTVKGRTLSVEPAKEKLTTAFEKLSIEKPLEKMAVVEKIDLWCVAPRKDVDQWRDAGEINHFNFFDADRVKNEVITGDDLQLLCIAVDQVTSDVKWIGPDETEVSSSVVVVGDGRLRIVGTPWPFDVATVVDLPKRDDSYIFPPSCVLRQGPKPQTLAPGLTIKY